MVTFSLGGALAENLLYCTGSAETEAPSFPVCCLGGSGSGEPLVLLTEEASLGSVLRAG